MAWVRWWLDRSLSGSGSTGASGCFWNLPIVWNNGQRPRHAALWLSAVPAPGRRHFARKLCGPGLGGSAVASALCAAACLPITFVRHTTLPRCRWLSFCAGLLLSCWDRLAMIIYHRMAMPSRRLFHHPQFLLITLIRYGNGNGCSVKFIKFNWIDSERPGDSSGATAWFYWKGSGWSAQKGDSLSVVGNWTSETLSVPTGRFYWWATTAKPDW